MLQSKIIPEWKIIIIGCIIYWHNLWYWTGAKGKYHAILLINVTHLKNNVCGCNLQYTNCTSFPFSDFLSKRDIHCSRWLEMDKTLYYIISLIALINCILHTVLCYIKIYIQVQDQVVSCCIIINFLFQNSRCKLR